MRLFLSALIVIGAAIPATRAQGNYEIQVYGADTVAPRSTMVELHSNFTTDCICNHRPKPTDSIIRTASSVTRLQH